MNQAKSIIKKYTGEFFILGGSSLFIYNLLRFSSNISTSLEQTAIDRIERLRQEPNDMAVYYFYDHQTIFLITLGIFLLVLGLLIIRHKKIENI